MRSTARRGGAAKTARRATPTIVVAGGGGRGGGRRRGGRGGGGGWGCLEAEAQAAAAAQGQQAELRLALSCLQDFAEQVQAGLAEAAWPTRREIIRALVKRIEVGNEELRMVYRVAPVPVVDRPF